MPSVTLLTVKNLLKAIPIVMCEQIMGYCVVIRLL